MTPNSTKSRNDPGQWLGSSLGRLALRALATLGLVATLASCAPTVAQRGEATLEASLDGDRFTAEDGIAMRFRTWLPDETPRAIFVAVHGMNEYSKAFETPAREWRARRIGVYALDQRGFGDSAFRGIWPGASNLSSDLAAFTRLVKSRHPGLPVYLLGESMGGGVVLVAASHADPLPIDGIILVAPSVAPWEDLPFHWRVPLWVMAHTVPWMSMTGRGLKLQPTDNIAIWREMSLDELVIKGTRVDALYGLTRLMDEAADAAPRVRYPALLLYGAKDDFVRDWMIDWLVEHLPEPRLDVITYDDGYHWLLRDHAADAVHRDILEWMDRIAAQETGGTTAGLQ